jgi:sporulation protein YlmC with PRC-barrel domain
MSRFVAFAVAAMFVGALPLGGAMAQAQQPPSATGGHASQQAGIAIASDSLLGTTVKDQQGNEVGKVSKLMIDPNEGKITSVIITRGGTLGMGGKELSMPWDALKLQRDQNQRLVVTMQREMLEQTPPAAPQRNGQPAASPPSGSTKQ